VIDAETHAEQQYLSKVVVGIDPSAALSVLTLDKSGERATGHRMLGVNRAGEVSAIEVNDEVDPEDVLPLDELARIVAATDPYNETADVVPFKTYKRIKNAYRDSRAS
jgi:hypothetical protein